MCDRVEATPRRPRIRLAWLVTTAQHITRRIPIGNWRAPNVTWNIMGAFVWWRREINRARNAMATFRSRMALPDTRDTFAALRMGIRSLLRCARLQGWLPMTA